MWLDEFMILFQPVFDSFLEIRKNIQIKLFKSGLHLKDDTDSLEVLVNDFYNNIECFGIQNQLIHFSDLPEIHLVSTSISLWTSVTFKFQVIKMGFPMILCMTHLGEKYFYEIEDPSEDYISLEILPKINLEFRNGTLCAANRFFVSVCAKNDVFVEDTQIPILLLPFCHLPLNPSVEWLITTSDGMDRMIDTFSKELHKKIKRTHTDLISTNGSFPTNLIRGIHKNNFAYDKPLLLNNSPLN